VVDEIEAWWAGNRAEGKASVLCAYALGKAQRILAELGRRDAPEVRVHGAIETLLEPYREAGIRLAPTRPVGPRQRGESFKDALILAPPSAAGSTWMRRFGDASTGFASGWMRVRGNRRRRGYDRGFVLSDHVDWPDLLLTIRESGANKVYATHGYSDTLARYLAGTGLAAEPLATLYEGEVESDADLD
jgi:putative mRNA 3-end processing factor